MIGDTPPPLSEAEFSALMVPLSPFEPKPVIAVACSGGADSMALTVLAHRWARRRRGRVVALTVDHGLRDGSGAEARLVKARLGALGIESHLLRWAGEKPVTRLQEAARDARYRLLEGWCRRKGVLHLLVAHHREDQAETFLQRLSRASGTDGLAAMPAIRETPWIRILRPCLDVPGARLRAILIARRVDWVEDPSNRNDAFDRVRLRKLQPALDREGLDAANLSMVARRMGLARATLEGETARLLARYVSVRAEGYALMDRELFENAPVEFGRRSLAATIHCIGGTHWPPRRARLERLYGMLSGAAPLRGHTLGGCRIIPGPRQILVVREAARCPEQNISAGLAIDWDARFRISLRKLPELANRALTIGPLGEKGVRNLKNTVNPAILAHIPALARPALPAFRDQRGLLAVPHLLYGRGRLGTASLRAIGYQFFPSRPLMGASFQVV